MGYALEKLPDWPIAMNRAAALAFTGLAPKLFDQIDRTGGIAGKRIGSNGEKVYPRVQLEALVERLFNTANIDIDDEVSGLNG